MEIILAADGELGLHLTKFLADENHNITVVNPEESILREFDNLFDVLTVQGYSTDMDVLKSANVNKADLLVSVMHEEEPNILTAILAKKLGAKKTIARVSNPKNLLKENRKILTEMGIDHLVSPEYFAAEEIIKVLKQTIAQEIFDFSNGSLSLFIQKLDEDANVLNMSLKEINELHKDLHFRAVAIKRDKETIIPDGDTILKLDDLAYIVTKPEGVEQIIELGGKTPSQINDVMIVGGGRIGRITAKRLENNINVKLIEKDKNRCHDLSDILKNTLIISGDSRNIDLLEDEQIESMDAFISVTNDSETNVMTCLIAKKMGVARTIALVENIDYIDVAKRIGIDVVINKKIIAASYIENFTIGFDVSSIKLLHGVDIDVIEIIAKENSKITKKPLNKIKFPKGAVIGGIVRKDNAFIADGNSQIMADDRVVVFTSPSKAHKVNKLFV